MARYLVFDASNVLLKTFFVALPKAAQDNDIAGFAQHTALTTFNKYFKQFYPHKVVMVFDRKPSWREIYTASDICVSKQPYKGDRQFKLSTQQKAQLTVYRQQIKQLENLLRTHTSMICLGAPGLEADDLVAGFVQQYSEKHELIIVSGDKDFIQLIKPNVHLYEPGTGQKRTLDNWDNDSELFLFEKCIRGGDDNVLSALPRVHKTRIRKAYNDRYERANLMNTTWVHPLTRQTFLTRDLFEENKLLMDLREQPEQIRRLITDTITKSVNNPGKFSYFHFMQHLGKYQLKRIADSIDNYIQLLSS